MKFACPHCNKEYDHPKAANGQKTTCVVCGKPFSVGQSPALIAAVARSSSTPADSELVCHACTAVPGSRAYLADDDSILCERCFFDNHKSQTDRLIMPTVPSDRMYLQRRCWFCSADYWILARDIGHAPAKCPKCRNVTEIAIHSQHFLLSSIRMAVWIMAWLAVASVILGIIAAFIAADEPSTRYRY